MGFQAAEWFHLLLQGFQAAAKHCAKHRAQRLAQGLAERQDRFQAALNVPAAPLHWHFQVAAECRAIQQDGFQAA